MIVNGRHCQGTRACFTCGEGLGLPIGNLSSQHFANFLLHWLDSYMEMLGFTFHGRYVDDFYIIHTDKTYMLECVSKIRFFLKNTLHTRLHPKKFYIQHYSKGVIFTGAVVKFDRLYPAKRTVRNFIFSIKRLNNAKSRQEVEKCLSSVNSYLGFMVHMKSYGLRKKVLSMMSEQTWDKVFVKGHYQSVHLRKNWKKRHIPKEDYPKVYYAKELNDHEI